MRAKQISVLIVALAVAALAVLGAGSSVGVDPAAADSPRSEFEQWFAHLREGIWIKVEGFVLESGGLQATEIKIYSGELDEWEIKSRAQIVQLARTTLQTQLGVTVVTTQRTNFEGPKKKRQVTFASLRVDDRIEAEGQLQKDGTLLAEELEIKKPKSSSRKKKRKRNEQEDHEMTARIESVDPETYSVQLMGVRVYFDVKTRNKTPLFN